MERRIYSVSKPPAWSADETLVTPNIKIPVAGKIACPTSKMSKLQRRIYSAQTGILVRNEVNHRSHRAPARVGIENFG